MVHAVLGLLLAVGVAVPAGAVGAAPSPSALASRALADAGVRGSVRAATRLVTESGTSAWTANVGEGEGRETLALSYATIDVIQLGERVYARSSTAAGLVQFIGWPARLAGAYADLWVSYPRTSTAFGDLTSDSNLAAVLGSLAIAGKLSARGPLVVDGRKALALSDGRPSQSAFSKVTLYVTDGASAPLPLREVQTGAGKLAEVTTLSDWSERLSLHAPSLAVPCPAALLDRALPRRPRHDL
jgi:hypothetical protein